MVLGTPRLWVWSLCRPFIWVALNDPCGQPFQLRRLIIVSAWLFFVCFIFQDIVYIFAKGFSGGCGFAYFFLRNVLPIQMHVDVCVLCVCKKPIFMVNMIPVVRPSEFQDLIFEQPAFHNKSLVFRNKVYFVWTGTSSKSVLRKTLEFVKPWQWLRGLKCCFFLLWHDVDFSCDLLS